MSLICDTVDSIAAFVEELDSTPKQHQQQQDDSQHVTKRVANSLVHDYFNWTFENFTPTEEDIGRSKNISEKLAMLPKELVDRVMSFIVISPVGAHTSQHTEQKILAFPDDDEDRQKKKMEEETRTVEEEQLRLVQEIQEEQNKKTPQIFLEDWIEINKKISPFLDQISESLQNSHMYKNIERLLTRGVSFYLLVVVVVVSFISSVFLTSRFFFNFLIWIAVTTH